MSIEKMKYVNIVGLNDRLDDVLLKIIESGCFHIEQSSKTISKNNAEFIPLLESNPYYPILKRILDLNLDDEFKLKKIEACGFNDVNMDEASDFISMIEAKSQKLDADISNLKTQISESQQSLIQLRHMQNMNVDLKQLFQIQHIHIRFGKLPIDSYPKLAYYSDKPLEFIPYDKDAGYYWGLYFAPVSFLDEADNIMKSLYFDRIWVSDYVSQKPQTEIENLNTRITKLNAELENALTERNKLFKENADKLNTVYCRLTFLYNVFTLRSYASVLNDKFYLVGFIPAKKEKDFNRLFQILPDVSIIIKPPDAEPNFTTPVKLKNNTITKPFSMFVEMYGLPSYNGYNPTNFVAITYMLLFGMMFGDLGQGLLIAIIGFIISKKKKSTFGAILTRIGISSAFFGLIYGSVFGFENLLNPLYKKLGFEHKPLEIMENTTLIIGAAICIGIVLIIISIFINIVIGLKNKNFEKALFGNNGVAGLIFFCSILTALISSMMFKKSLLTPAYVICLLILPIVFMFLREPLGHLLAKKPFKPDSIGDFIASNFFEVFEFMLGYATNTLSFIRIGGFIFSHAGMMSVVMMLSESVSHGASPIVIILGNAFVMVMEGMIVGIQVLRLEFYEIFSRFYDGDGRAFDPVTVKNEPIVK